MFNNLGILSFILFSGLNLITPTDTVVYLDNGRYVGQYPVGKGVLYSEKKGMIMGWFKECVPHGHCIHYRTNGSIYEGEMQDGKYFGNGRYFTLAGNVITGDFFNNTATGRDTMYYSTGTIYVGSMFDKQPHGEGIKLTPVVRSRTRYRYTNLVPEERWVYLFREGTYRNGDFVSGFCTYLSAPAHRWIVTASVTDGVYSWIYRNALARYASHICSQEELERDYMRLYCRKPAFPIVPLTEEQLSFLRTHCCYDQWFNME